MSLRVNNNITAINAQRAIGRNSNNVNRQLERLASGLRVNRASDDAAGLVVSEGMRSELAGLGQNVRNAEQASNLLQVAEGSLQVGPRADVVNRIEVGIGDLRASGTNLNLADLTLNTLSSARQAFASLDLAINTVANERGKLGAVQNRLEFTIAYSQNEIESIQASEASIRDADVAFEVSSLSRAQILLQSSSAMLVQSNVLSVQALTLL